MKNTKIAYILVGAAKRRGKDTIAQMLIDAINNLNQPDNFVARKYAFAACLREEVRIAFEMNGVGLDVYSEDPQIKEIAIRPILIAWGQMRRFQDPNYWVNALLEDVKGVAQGGYPSKWHVAVISDWRFPNELEVVRNSPEADLVKSVHLYRPDVPYAGPDEEKNDPLCQEMAGLQVLNTGNLVGLRAAADAYISNSVLPLLK